MFLNTHTHTEMKRMAEIDRTDAMRAFEHKVKFDGKMFPQTRVYNWTSSCGNEYIIVGRIESKNHYKKGYIIITMCPIIRDHKGICICLLCENRHIVVTPHVLSRYKERMGIEGSQTEVAMTFLRRNSMFCTAAPSMHGDRTQYDLTINDGVLFLSEEENGNKIAAKTFVENNMLKDDQKKRMSFCRNVNIGMLEHNIKRALKSACLF